MPRRRRSGFALITVLWILAAAAVAGIGSELAIRDSVNGARNRVHIERAAWRAHACLERARAAIDDALQEGERAGSREPVWRDIDHYLRASPLLPTASCHVTLEAAGTRLDVNAATDAQLAALFASMQMEDPVTFTDRVLDWRDSDDAPRPFGAERGWYITNDVPGVAPRNARIEDIRELAIVGARVDIAQLEHLLTVERGRISLNHAPAAILAVLPGFTDETVARVIQDRAHNRATTDLMALAARLTPAAAERLLASIPQLASTATTTPDAWLLRARGWSGEPAITAVLDARLVLSNGRAALQQVRRYW